MKVIHVLFLFAVSLLLSCNSTPEKKQKEKTVYAEYSLPLPDKWTKEVFSIPISFAPEINYKGHEEIRFAPGWGDSTKNDYWTYAFLWCIDADPNISNSIVFPNFKTRRRKESQNNFVIRKLQFHLFHHRQALFVLA